MRFFRLLAMLAVFISASIASFSQPAAENPVFIENKGQWNPNIQYKADIKGGAVAVCADGIVYDMRKIEIEKKESEDPGYKLRSSLSKVYDRIVRRSGQAIKMKLVEPASKLDFAGKRLEHGVRNYFIGADPEKWATNVRSYSIIQSENVYEGVSMRLSINEGSPRYDFLVDAGADPRQIRFQIEGAPVANIDSDGEAEFESPLGKIIHGDIFAYQTINGAKKQIPCEIVKNGSEFSFKLAKYDRSKPLVIDPLVFSTFIGGELEDAVEAVRLCDDNTLAVAGWTMSIDLPHTPGVYDSTYIGGKDGFVAKYKIEGTTRSLIFLTYLGSDGEDEVTSMDVDAEGNVYVAGYTNSDEFPTKSAFQQVRKGKNDGFITKLGSDGAALLYSTYIGGEQNDEVTAIAIGASGAAYITGGTFSTDFPTAAPDSPRNYGLEDPFISKISSSGGSIIFSTYFGQTNMDRGTAIDVDESQDRILIGVETNSGDLWARPTNSGWDRWFYKYVCFDYIHNGGYDAFIMKYKKGGGERDFAAFYGGILDEKVNAIEIASDGNYFFAGETTSSAHTTEQPSKNKDFPIKLGAYQENYGGGERDAYIAKIDYRAEHLLASTYFGGRGVDRILDVAINEANNSVVVTGATNSSDFPIRGVNENPKPTGVSDVFLSEFDVNLSSCILSTLFGGEGEDVGNSVVVDEDGFFFIGGATNNSRKFPITDNATQSEFGGVSDGFVLKYVNANLYMTSPNENLIACVGSQNQITWNSEGLKPGAEYTLDVSANDGELWSPLFTDEGIIGAIADNQYLWRVPLDFPQSDDVKVRVVHRSGLYDDMEHSFSVRRSPEIAAVNWLASSLCPGGSITFSVDAVGAGLNYVWQKDGNAIANANSATFILENIKSGDAGEYNALITNECSPAAESEIINVEILKTTRALKSPGDTVVFENSSVRFEAEGEGEDLSYQWQKNGLKIAAATNPYYEIAIVQKADSGKYRCVVSGTCGADTTETALLTVLDDPESVYDDFDFARDGLSFRVQNDMISAPEAILRSDCEQYVKLTVANNLGGEISTLFEGYISKGVNRFPVDIDLPASGVYWIIAQTNSGKSAKKFAIIK